MERPLPDTSVFSSHIEQIEQNIRSFHFSAIVFYELMASTIDESTLKKYEMWNTSLYKIGKLLTPSRTDWLTTARAVRRLRHLKLINKNLSPTVLQNDALIARSAVMHDCFIVTNNIRDYHLLQKVMPKLDVIPAKDFFS